MRVAARSEPAWGSVRFMVAAHSPLTILSSQVAFSSSLAGLKVMIAAVAEEFRLYNGRAVLLVALVMLVLGTASALSFTPLEWRIAGEPVLDVIDRVAGGDVIIFSGITGAALLCWFIPPQRIRTVLGTGSRWWEWRIYLVGRYLPVLVAVWSVITYGISQLAQSG